MGDDSVAAMIGDVVSAWRAAARVGIMSTQTVDKFTLLTTRFEHFVVAHDVVSVNDLSVEVVRDFVHAYGRDRRGRRVRPSLATTHNRLSTLRVLFRTARSIGIGYNDPTDQIVLPLRESTTVQRPVTDNEAELLRFFADTGAHKRHATVVALLLAGARTGELGFLTVADVKLDPTDGWVWAHGSLKYEHRRLRLDGPARQVLVDRISVLGDDPDTPLCDAGAGSEAAQQARIGMSVASVFHAAGLAADPSLRPTSLTAYAAANAFARSERIEDAAWVVGLRSLDSAATLINFEWQGLDR